MFTRNKIYVREYKDPTIKIINTILDPIQIHAKDKVLGMYNHTAKLIYKEITQQLREEDVLYLAIISTKKYIRHLFEIKYIKAVTLFTRSEDKFISVEIPLVTTNKIKGLIHLLEINNNQRKLVHIKQKIVDKPICIIKGMNHFKIRNYLKELFFNSYRQNTIQKIVLQKQKPTKLITYERNT